MLIAYNTLTIIKTLILFAKIVIHTLSRVQEEISLRSTEYLDNTCHNYRWWRCVIWRKAYVLCGMSHKYMNGGRWCESNIVDQFPPCCYEIKTVILWELYLYPSLYVVMAMKLVFGTYINGVWGENLINYCGWLFTFKVPYIYMGYVRAMAYAIILFIWLSLYHVDMWMRFCVGSDRGRSVSHL